MKKKLCAVMVFVLTAVMASGCVKKEEIQKYSHVDYAMGTVTNTTLYGRSPDLSEAEQEMMEKMKKLETEQLSWRKDSSAVAKLNQGNQRVADVPEPLFTWMKKSLQIAKDSKGAADPAIGSLTRMWDFESENPKVPDADKIKALIKDGIVSNAYEHVKLNEKQKTVRKAREIKMDLGAFGKGIGTDEAMRLSLIHI